MIPNCNDYSVNVIFCGNVFDDWCCLNSELFLLRRELRIIFALDEKCEKCLFRRTSQWRNMVSPNKTKKRHHGDLISTWIHKSNKKKKRSSSVLKSEKIFFHFKNHLVLTKYHSKLKSFGATIAPFLEKDVTLVVTDVSGCNGKWTPVTECLNLKSPCYSVSPATPVSGDDCATKKSRTRADAMLERIPTQTTNVLSANPLSNAISWNIPIYSIDIFQIWLEKKLSQIRIINEKSEEIKRQANAKILERSYLKFESSTKYKYRPEFREVSRWPRIYSNTLPGSCPFDKRAVKKSNKRVEKNNAVQKNGSERMNRSCNKQTNDAGYCEICAVHYRDLSQHVTDSKHMKFVCNDKNYADLDNCIKTRSVEAFLAAHQSSGPISNSKESNNIEEMGRNLRKSVSLHLNNNNENSAVTRAIRNAKLLDESLKQPLQVQCNGFTNYHLRKSAIKSDSVLMKSAAACYDTKELLRETRKLYASCPDGNNLPDGARDLVQLSPVEDDSLHRLRSRRNLLLPSTLIGTTAEDANRHRSSNAASPQTPSPGSNHFLRSSVSPRALHTTRHKLPSHEESSKKGTASTPCKDTRTVGGGSHFTRSRPENGIVSPNSVEETFKGGKRKPSLTSDEEDKRKPSEGHSYQTKRFKIALHDEFAADKQRKRLSTEEKFLEDNKEYYKVEMVRTKLRSTEHFCNQEIVKKDEPKEQQEKTLREEKKMVKRNSRLELLHQEAKEFMYGPPKDEDDSDESDDDDDDNNDDDKKSNKDVSTPNGDLQAENEQSNAIARRQKGKQRRTHAELFIKDNLDYYKFEMSNSRLRHGDKTNSTPVVRVKEEALTDDESKSPSIRHRTGKKFRRRDTEPEPEPAVTTKEEQQPEPEGGSEYCDRPKPPSDSLRFSFETVPCKESWYKAFERFDSCQETYVKIPDTVYFNRYREVRPYGGIVQKQAIAALQKQTILATTGTSPPSPSASSSIAMRKNGLRHHKLPSRLIIDDKPRKSPRCHASTLAILSNITGSRRRSRKMIVDAKRRHPTKPAHSTPTPAQEAENAKSIAELKNQEALRRLNESTKKVAKEADTCFINEFGREDCDDAYLRKLKSEDDEKSDSSSWHVCMTIDEEILHDHELLRSFTAGYDEKIGDMSSFMESSQHCTSMESALDEDLYRVHEPLSRLCRENDVSCNSSDCGGSSTCEFLGFAEDGRHVSRRRKRKRANMTGWPPDRKIRKPLRQITKGKNATQMNGTIDEEEEGKETNNSEMESEGVTDDDLPLTEIASKKKKEQSKNKGAKRSLKTPTRRSLRGSLGDTSLQRLSHSRRRNARCTFNSRRLR